MLFVIFVMWQYLGQKHFVKHLGKTLCYIKVNTTNSANFISLFKALNAAEFKSLVVEVCTEKLRIFYTTGTKKENLPLRTQFVTVNTSKQLGVSVTEKSSEFYA